MKFYTVLIIFLLVGGCHPKGPLYDVNGENIEVSGKDSINKKIEKIVQPYRSEMDIEMDIVIGQAPQTLFNSRTEPETHLGNWVADVVFKSGFEYLESNNIAPNKNLCFALLNKGGLRAPLNKGDITVGNIYEIMPFDNEIVIVKLEARMIKHIINYLFEITGQPVSNAIFYLSSNAGKVEIGNQHFDYSQPVYIVTSDYLAKGGDNMDFFKNSINYIQTGILIRDELLKNVKTSKQIISPKDFGRIQFIK